MAKHLVITLLTAYKIIISPLFSHILGTKVICRYNPSCSEYMMLSVKKYGVVKGVGMGLSQLATCHPFDKVNYGRNI